MHIIQYIDNSVHDTSFATIDQVIQWMQEKWTGREPSLSIKTKHSDLLPGTIKATFIVDRIEERKIVATVHTLRKSKIFLSPGEEQ